MKQLLKKLTQSAARKTGEVSADRTTRLFIHIPKTAGTSFRVAAESWFGKRRVIRDYGPESEATSQSVKREVYDTGNNNGILKAIKADQASLLAGHFPLKKYGPIIGLHNTVTIFRDPIEQVISHYRHATAHHGYKGSLLEFARRKGIRNIQTRFLCNLDPALIGIVGLTESYKDSLALINQRWGWNLKHHKKNVSDRFDRQGIKTSSEERSELTKLNREDLNLYQRACQVYENSNHCAQNQVASDPRGAFLSVASGKPISGWAFDMNSGTPLEIMLLINNKNAGQQACDQFYEDLGQWKLACGDKMGFKFEKPIVAGDAIEIRDVTTGLTLDRRMAF